MIFARRVFTGAWIYGVIVLLPLLFLETQIVERAPPAFAHPEFYYGFLGVALSWQLVFVLIAREPARLRPVMLPAVLEKVGWGVGVLVLVQQGRTSTFFLGGALIDLALAVLFLMAWQRSRRETP